MTREDSSPEPAFLVMCGGLLLSGVLFPLVLMQKLFQRAPKLLSFAIWLDMTLIISLYSGLMPGIEPSEDLPAVFFVIIVLYMMLPLPKSLSLLLGLLNMATQLLIAGFVSKNSRDHLVFQVGENLFYFTHILLMFLQ